MKLKPKDFTNEADGIVDELESYFKQNPFEISDVLDSAGNQYVDLVMEGGGVLGIALVGYTYVLERMKIRFLNVGGTSAGAINALLLASLGNGIQDTKSDKAIKYLADIPLEKFIDGDQGVQNFIRFMLETEKAEDDRGVSTALWQLTKAIARTGLSGTAEIAKDLGVSKGAVDRVVDALTKIGDFSPTLTNALGVLDDFIIDKKLGLNPGEAFYNWLRDVLVEEKINSTADLFKKLEIPPDLYFRETREDLKNKTLKDDPPKGEGMKCKLALIAADVSTETKVVFPEMANLFWEDYENVNPAEYVRASMSVPFFFVPHRAPNIADKLDGERALAYRRKWRELGYRDYEQGGWPKEHLFIDGGIISNFPIDQFHATKKIPSAPTFGVKLGRDERKTEIGSLGRLTGAVFNSARHSLDYDFINKNPDYQHLIGMIDTGNHYWLNFGLEPDAKLDLFRRGALAAKDFLENFDWGKYKEIRKNLMKAYVASEDLKKAQTKDKDGSTTIGN
jgi:NTE family protein